MKTELCTALCTAIEALEEFQHKHYDWPYVRRETEAIKAQLENVLSRLEHLLEDMKNIEKERSLHGNAIKLKVCELCGGSDNVRCVNLKHYYYDATFAYYFCKGCTEWIQENQPCRDRSYDVFPPVLGGKDPARDYFWREERRV